MCRCVDYGTRAESWCSLHSTCLSPTEFIRFINQLSELAMRWSSEMQVDAVILAHWSYSERVATRCSKDVNRHIDLLACLDAYAFCNFFRMYLGDANYARIEMRGELSHVESKEIIPSSNEGTIWYWNVCAEAKVINHLFLSNYVLDAHGMISYKKNLNSSSLNHTTVERWKKWKQLFSVLRLLFAAVLVIRSLITTINLNF